MDDLIDGLIEDTKRRVQKLENSYDRYRIGSFHRGAGYIGDKSNKMAEMSR